MKTSILMLLLAGLWHSLQAQDPVLVKELNPDGNAFGHSFIEFQGELWFAANVHLSQAALWKSDGTESGTVTVPDKNGNHVSPGGFVVYQNKLIFNGSNSQHGSEVWVSDGTSQGTFMLMDIAAGTTGSHPRNFTVAAGLVFFTTHPNGGSFSHQLWRTDGTLAGTFWVKDINPGDNIYTRFLMPFQNKLFFDATDPDHGHEMWVSDGTANGTQLFYDLDSGAAKSGQFYAPFVFKNRIYFTGKGEKLWVSDGTVSGTYPLQDSMPSPVDIKDPYWFTPMGDKMYFVARNTTVGEELWVTDGTDSGTRLVVETAPGYNGSDLNFLTVVGESIYFSNLSQGSGTELWISDGTADGTHLLKEIAPGTASSQPRRFTPFGDKVYFTAEDGTNGKELWVSDGTDTGTKKITPTFATASSPMDEMNVISFLVIDTTLFFTAAFDSKGSELYKITTRKPQPNGVKLPEDQPVTVYPNPFSDRIYLSGAGTGSHTGVYVTDMHGKTWLLEGAHIMDDGLVEIHMPANLTPGVYSLMIPGRNQRVKIIRL